ncbi:Olfactory receptor 7G2 [Sciurus carolinensis]|uniref:Olfactory receptor 7G2 n=1 Tax=Sciurus carolinensis TaxID=30640 RepID=A0AA41MYW5_SCICA|nr:Olfactory receptor 7G2 [Sciurus carolinensis]
MESENQTGTIEFLLLGLSEDPELQPVLLGLFLSIYLVTVIGNLLIILAVSSDTHLHTPMYFFLSNLSFTDISFFSTTVPKMLVNIQRQSKTISYTGCLPQVCFVLVFAGVENSLLAAMVYDNYVAICHSLRYSVIMNPRLCVLLIELSLTISVVYGLLHSLMVLRLSFCTDLEVPHFFCELDQVIKLSCSATLINNILFYLVSSIVGGVPLLGIIYPYNKIVSSILRMSSAGGRHKAFSTCGSHLSVVSLFYGTGFGVYIGSAVTDSFTNTAAASVMYTVVPPMLNPFIYSLRNRDMKEALRKLIINHLFFSNCVICFGLGLLVKFKVQGHWASHISYAMVIEWHKGEGCSILVLKPHLGLL